MKTTVEVHPTDTPARDLPFGMVYEVAQVLKAHGCDPNLVELMISLKRVIDATPATDGGRKGYAEVAS